MGLDASEGTDTGIDIGKGTDELIRLEYVVDNIGW